MNNKIVEYLQTYKDKYTQKSLAQQLYNAGHDSQEIQAAMAFVYGTQSVPLFSEKLEKEGGWFRKLFGF